MQQEGIFKTTSFGGFDKKSVLTYIDNLTERFRLAEQEYQKQLDGFSKAQDSQVSYIQKMESQLGELEEKLEVLAGELETARANPSSAVPAGADHSEELENAQSKLTMLTQTCQQREQELELQQEVNRQLQFKMEAMEFKSKKYDEISGEVGDALLAARQTAEQMTRQSLQEMQQKKAESEQEISELLTRARQESEHLLTQAREESEQILTHARQESEQLLVTAKEQAQAIAKEAETRLERFHGELASFKSDSGRLRKSIEEILFVLNDRVDVMQEIVAQVEKRCTSDNVSQNSTREEQPFKRVSDNAGLFGGVLHEDENA